MTRIVSRCRKCGVIYQWDLGDFNWDRDDSEIDNDYERAFAIWKELKPGSGKKLESHCPTCAGMEIRMFISKHCKSSVSYRRFKNYADYLHELKKFSVRLKGKNVAGYSG